MQGKSSKLNDTQVIELGRINDINISLIVLENSTKVIEFNNNKDFKQYIELKDFNKLIKNLDIQKKNNNYISNKLIKKVAEYVISDSIDVNQSIIEELVKEYGENSVKVYCVSIGMGMNLITYGIGVIKDRSNNEEYGQAVISQLSSAGTSMFIYSVGLQLLSTMEVGRMLSNPLGLLAATVCITFLSNRVGDGVNSFIDHLFEKVDNTIQIDDATVRITGTENNLNIAGSIEDIQKARQIFGTGFLREITNSFKVRFDDSNAFNYNLRTNELEIIVNSNKYNQYVEEIRDKFPNWFEKSICDSKMTIIESKGRSTVSDSSRIAVNINNFFVRSRDFIKSLKYKDKTLKKWGYDIPYLIKFNSWLKEDYRLSSELEKEEPKLKKDSFIILSSRESKLVKVQNDIPALIVPEGNKDILYGTATNTIQKTNKENYFKFFTGHGSNRDYKKSDGNGQISINGQQIGQDLERIEVEKRLFEDQGEYFKRITIKEKYKESTFNEGELTYTYDLEEDSLTIEYGAIDKLVIKDFKNSDYNIYLTRNYHTLKGSLDCEIIDTKIYEINKEQEGLFDYHLNEHYRSNGGKGIKIDGELIGREMNKVGELDDDYLEYRDENQCYYLFSPKKDQLLIQYGDPKGRFILIEDFVNGDYGLAFEGNHAIMYGSKDRNKSETDVGSKEYRFGKAFKNKSTPNNRYIYNDSNGNGEILINLGDVNGDYNLAKITFIKDNYIVYGKKCIVGFRNKDKQYMTILCEYDIENDNLIINFGPSNMWKIEIENFVNGDYGINLPIKIDLICGSAV
ncbi:MULTISPECIES: hypothetical protein [unclassified Candidatus Frackibacter]|uniref:hypothetical protein n=1 Tax=unclassified Candidatus Frackibacter TaxID=2648818 RepID=UPI00087E2574|nr:MULTISPECIES: hypothetical protein [unclassified Candidatus Frackibacter]SDC60234.1 hypothetical protein SAMN04515661_11558 [Candidatus Frackibacter sp. WG11]SEM41757.1 hypothetical protein SAMN04488698_10398 [Candidatus Frackibacter sp. WG12]SFL84335.1 hypothetical protein SAMN04488699_1164 [Candidatus Frackibacter sp. WG13]